MPYTLEQDKKLITAAVSIFSDTWLYLQGLIDLNAPFRQQCINEMRGIRSNLVALNKSSLFPDNEPKLVVSEHNYSMLLRQVKLFRLFSSRTKEAYKQIEILSKHEPAIDIEPLRNKLIVLYDTSLQNKKFKDFADYIAELEIACHKIANNSEDAATALQKLKLLSDVATPNYQEATINLECQKIEMRLKNCVATLLSIEQDKSKQAHYREYLMTLSRKKSEAITFDQKIQFIKTFSWICFKLTNDLFTIKQEQTAATCKTLPLLYLTEESLRNAQETLIAYYEVGAYALVKHAQQIKKFHQENSLPKTQEPASKKQKM